MVKWLVNSRRLPLIASEMRGEFLFEKWLSFGILGRKRHGARCMFDRVSVVSEPLPRSIAVKDAKHFTTSQSRSFSREPTSITYQPVYAKLVVNPIEIYIKTEDNTPSKRKRKRKFSRLFQFIRIFIGILDFKSFKLIRGY